VCNRVIRTLCRRTLRKCCVPPKTRRHGPAPTTCTVVTSVMATKQGSRKSPVFVRQLDRAARRHVFVVAAMRLAAFLAVILVLYFGIPIGGFNEDNPAAAWIRLAGVLLVFVSALVIQLRMIIAAEVPQVRAAEAVVETVLMFLFLFAFLYTSMSTTDPRAFTEPLSRMDALYFTTVTFATVGFGDITPVSQLARAVVTVQMIAGLGALVLVAKVAFFAAGRRLGTP
jgi:voltage-gated potassium channel